MRLYLVRHGEAKPKSQDPDRPLTEAGAADVAKVAAFLQGRGIRVEAVWHSGKTRARQTADLLASALPAGAGPVHRDGLAPNDPVRRAVKEVAAARGDLMIVGHLPHLAGLAAALLVGDAQAEVLAFPAAGAACLARDEQAAWVLEWLVTPDLLPQRANRGKAGRPGPG